MKIVQYPHPALRRPVKPLTSIDESVRTQARQMLDLMYESRGVGLAANQVVYPYQLLVINPSADPGKKDEEMVLINPVIVQRKGSVEAEEGCLSFPGLYQKIRRSRSIQVQFYNLEGKLVEASASEFPARVIQHEVDHLQGVLYIDKMGWIARLDSRTKLREFEEEYRRAQRRGEIPPDAEIEKQLAAM